MHCLERQPVINNNARRILRREVHPFALEVPPTQIDDQIPMFDQRAAPLECPTVRERKTITMLDYVNYLHPELICID